MSTSSSLAANNFGHSQLVKNPRKLSVRLGEFTEKGTMWGFYESLSFGWWAGYAHVRGNTLDPKANGSNRRATNYLAHHEDFV